MQGERSTDRFEFGGRRRMLAALGFIALFIALFDVMPFWLAVERGPFFFAMIGFGMALAVWTGRLFYSATIVGGSVSFRALLRRTATVRLSDIQAIEAVARGRSSGFRIVHSEGSVYLDGARQWTPLVAKLRELIPGLPPTTGPAARWLLRRESSVVPSSKP